MIDRMQGALDERDVARLLGVSRRTVQKWRYCGRGPRWRKIEGAVRYVAEDVAAYLDSCPQPRPRAPNEHSSAGGAS
jgi:predicted DNA-binding transcriptional regulator AlpA